MLGAAASWEGAHVYVGTDENEELRLQNAWAATYLGPQSYSLLSGYTFFALPQRLASLLDLGAQVDRLSSTVPFTWTERERIHMLHWLAVSQVCMLVEEFAALISAVRAWRNARKDVATTYLGWRDDPTAVLDDPIVGTREDWEYLSNYAGHDRLRDLGLTEAEASSFASALDVSLMLITEGVTWARAFFTDEIRRIYARFKHGFSLLSPLSTPIHLDVELTDHAARHMMLESIFIMDYQRRRQPQLLAMRSTAYDFSGALQTAARVAGLNSFLATTLVAEARSPEHRAIALGTVEEMGGPIKPLPDIVQIALMKYTGVDPTTAKYFIDPPATIRRLQSELFTSADQRRGSQFDDAIARVALREKG